MKQEGIRVGFSRHRCTLRLLIRFFSEQHLLLTVGNTIQRGSVGGIIPLVFDLGHPTECSHEQHRSLNSIPFP